LILPKKHIYFEDRKDLFGLIFLFEPFFGFIMLLNWFVHILRVFAEYFWL
jgi:hypothetical protein